jgi:30S ribosomal protein S31
MGKGDKRSRRGKIFAGSYGKTRPKNKKKHTAEKAENQKKTEE